MKISTMLLVASLTHTVVAMDDQPQGLQYISCRNQDSIREFWGIVDTSPTGTLDCYVSYNSKTMSYYGVLHNNKYEPEKKWLNESLMSPKAQYYYEQLMTLLLIKKNQ